MRSITDLTRELVTARASAVAAGTYLDKLRRTVPPPGQLAGEHAKLLTLAERHAALAVARDRRVQHTLDATVATARRVASTIVQRARVGAPTERLEAALLELLGEAVVPADDLAGAEHCYVVALLAMRAAPEDGAAAERWVAARRELLGERVAA